MSTSRNTVNQRNARARRKDHIASLEVKLQHYEQQGIQATREVQVAAQKVVEENQRLKEELERLSRALEESDRKWKELAPGSGAIIHNDHEEVNGRRRRRSQESGSSVIGLPKEHPKRRKQSSDQDAAASQSSRQGKSASHLPEQQKSPPDIRHAARCPSPTPRVTPSPLPENNDPPTPQLILPDTPPSHSPPQRDPAPPRCNPVSPNTMPCAEAALIIAGMRGTHNPSDIYPDLGCASADVYCSVQNLKVMEMMERD